MAKKKTPKKRYSVQKNITKQKTTYQVIDNALKYPYQVLCESDGKYTMEDICSSLNLTESVFKVQSKIREIIETMESQRKDNPISFENSLKTENGLSTGIILRLKEIENLLKEK